ncbi:cache domain-containing protein [Halalkalibacter urbisdiaboli]|uniref:cache domain-containing protein n=1 Tax=Halalkalibacter urbisdiaboli TaxID=1960589 RepID=UPI000B441447|nr:cache domain-containing protein [Halalkalibacter urbisdiaboli]
MFKNDRGNKQSDKLRFRNSLILKVMLLVSIIVLLSSSLLGFVSYQTAKNELIDAGKENMKSIVTSAKSTISELDKEVKAGHLTIEEAKERARNAIVGPVITEGEPNRDFSQSAFVYKNIKAKDICLLMIVTVYYKCQHRFNLV